MFQATYLDNYVHVSSFAVSQSLYRLSYPALHIYIYIYTHTHTYLFIYINMCFIITKILISALFWDIAKRIVVVLTGVSG